MANCLDTQRRRNALTPLIRFNVISPYTNPITGESNNITEQQLNMRRKVEILKYESNRMPSQTNSLTKKQKWSRLSTQTAPNGRGAASSCIPDASIKIPTSSPDVPGKVMLLYEDPTIPLYNYIITRSYAYNVPNPNGYWDTTVNTNVGIYSGIETGVFTLAILPNINKSSYKFTLSTPIGIRAQGIFKAASSHTTIKINVSSAILNVYCNGTLLPEKRQIYNLTNRFIKFYGNETNSTDAAFNITQLAGPVSFSNISLETSPIYSFEFTLTLSINLYKNSSITPMTASEISSIFGSSLQYYAYANITNVVPIVADNCTFVPQVPPVVSSEPGIFGS